jgi:hypothetical protein
MTQVLIPALLSLALPAAAEIPFPAALDAAAVSVADLSDLNREALPIGNGDLNALVWERDGTLCLRVAKNDIWDARVDTSADPPLMKVDVANGKWSGGGYPPSWRKPYPTPRGAAIVRIGAERARAWQPIRAQGRTNSWAQSGPDTGTMLIDGDAGASSGYRYRCAATSTGAASRFSFLIQGGPGARYYVNLFGRDGKAMLESGWRDTPPAETEVAFPLAAPVSAVELYIMTAKGGPAENRIRQIRLAQGTGGIELPPGRPPGTAEPARLDLRRAVATTGRAAVRALAGRNVFLIETEEDLVDLEALSAGLPAAELGETDGARWLRQKLPGDEDYAGMEYAFAVAGSGSRKAVAVVTSRDVKGDVVAAAVKLARETAAEDAGALIARHEAEWARYWAASGVQLDDPDFQLWWYRMAYMLRCFSKPGVVPAGLWAFQPTDSPAWHGDYHHNYNAWQPYWTSFILNHPDQAKPWVDYMNELLPRLKWFARETFNCEGAFVGISSFAYEPDPAVCRSRNRRQIAMAPWGYTMGMIGMSAQVLWHHHLYAPDRDYLAAKIYPVVREAALFFCSFAEQCPRDANGKAKYGPSYSPEHGGFGVHNVPFDLAYARFSLQAAIQAAGELGRDADLAARFRKAIDLLPDYPTAPDAAGQPVVVDWTGCKFRQIGEHNIIVPVVPVFPGEQVTWFSPEPVKELFRNTIRQTRHRGCNSTIMMSVAKARLGEPDALDHLRDYYKPNVQPNGMFYWPMHGFYLAESVGIAAGISEFLLQSVDHIIRVFPAWPKEKDARFTNLRAQGGFLVSAEQKDGKVAKVEITSTVGGRLRVLDPWTGKLVERDTRAGETVELEP